MRSFQRKYKKFTVRWHKIKGQCNFYAICRRNLNSRCKFKHVDCGRKVNIQSEFVSLKIVIAVLAASVNFCHILAEGEQQLRDGVEWREPTYEYIPGVIIISIRYLQLMQGGGVGKVCLTTPVLIL